MSTSADQAVKIADEWLHEHRVSESWRIINMLRDELVRATDRQVDAAAAYDQGILAVVERLPGEDLGVFTNPYGGDENA